MFKKLNAFYLLPSTEILSGVKMIGLLGAVSRDCSKDLFYGVDYHSHLGTEIAGLTTLYDEIMPPVIHNINQGQFKTEFGKDLEKLKGNLGIGVISSVKGDRQPLLFKSKNCNFALCTSGSVKNAYELRSKLIDEGVTFVESADHVNQTELIGNLISRGTNFTDGITKMYGEIDGSISFLLLSESERCIYASSGVFPLVIGKRGYDWAVASETSAFPNLEYEIHRYIDYQEVISISEMGIKEKLKASGRKRFCSFLFSYFGFPSSNYYGINTEMVRERCGGFLAEKDDVKPDLVVGVADSGFTYAIGCVKRKIELVKERAASLMKEYKEDRIEFDEFKSTLMNVLEELAPLRRPVVKYTPSWGRSYLPPEQYERDMIAYFKQIPIPEMISGYKIVLFDDSIRRGTQLAKLLKEKVWPYKPVEVHVRIGSPPQFLPCKYDDDLSNLATCKAIAELEGVDVRNIRDVSRYVNSNSVEYNMMVDKIGENIGATTLSFITLEEQFRAILKAPGNIGLKKEDLCTYCWTGKD